MPRRLISGSPRPAPTATRNSATVANDSGAARNQRGKLPTRGEAIRHLLDDTPTGHAFAQGSAGVAGTRMIVYGHHRPNLSKRLLDLQHGRAAPVLATTHVHREHDTCLEVIILRGPAASLLEAAAGLRGLEGIRTGQLVLAATSDAMRVAPFG